MQKSLPNEILLKGNTLFYHNHIKSNIEKVDKRKQDYIKHRLQFLRRFCQPLDDKISKLDSQTDYYNHLIENQNEMIENQQEVAELKNQIKQFVGTQKYFLEHLEEYQGQIIDLTFQNQLIQQKIKEIRNQIMSISKQKSEKVYQQISERDKKSVSSNLMNSGISQRKKGEQHVGNTLLPRIFKVQKYYVNKETHKIEKYHKYQQNSIQKDKLYAKKLKDSQINASLSILEDFKISQINQNQKQQFNNSTTQMKYSNKMKEGNHQKINEINQKEKQLKAKFKQITTNFNKFQLLFKQCFQRKKNHVQKSVSQLQSRLIANRQKFLQICQAIGEKSFKSIPFEQFQKLTGDQMMTILLSFPWIQKKIFKQFAQRRKDIIFLQKNKDLIQKSS